MDFLRRNLEAAQAQALSAALTAQKSAVGFAQSVSEQGKAMAGNLTENTKVLADQATTLSSTAVESAQSRLRTLELPSALNARLGALAKPAEAEPIPESELLAYGVSAELREFIRSLTYSTFRDFPQDALPADTQARPEAIAVLLRSTAEERHAMLVVQSTREINELRYVLCPKRMSDATFWQIYFLLVKKLLPDAAFEAAPAPPGPHRDALSLADLQTRLSQLGSSAKDFVSHTGASLRTAAGTLGQGAKSGAGPAAAAATLAEAAATGRARVHGGNGAAAAGDAEPASGLGLGADHELEAALRDAMRSGSPGGFSTAGSEDAGGFDDAAAYEDAEGLEGPCGAAGSDASGEGGAGALAGRQGGADGGSRGAPARESPGGNGARDGAVSSAEPAREGLEEEGGGKGGGSGEDDEAEDDFDRYLSELNEEGASGGGSHGGASGDDSGEELDLSEYMRDVK